MSHKHHTYKLDFTQALIDLKNGYCLARKDWKDGMCLKYTDNSAHWKEGTGIVIKEDIQVSFYNTPFYCWKPSVDDLLANDWISHTI